MSEQSQAGPSNINSKESSLDALERMAENPAVTASEIRRGEFTENGAGATGIAYRAILRTSEDQMDDVWSAILALCSSLWEKDDIVSATLLIEKSAYAFPIPDSMSDRVQNAINDAKDLKIVKAAENAFEAGDDEKATRIAQGLTRDIAKDYRPNLSQRIAARHKTRMMAMWTAGISVSSLLMVAVIGVFSAIELMKDPPRPELPSFADSTRMFDDIFSTIESPGPAIDQIINAPADDLVGLIPAGAKAPGNEDEKILEDVEANTLDETPLVTNSILDFDHEEPATPVVPLVADEARDQTRKNCILGLAALQRASEIIATAGDNQAEKKRLAQFMSTLQDACRELNMDPVALSVEAGSLDPDQVEDIAKGILQGAP